MKKEKGLVIIKVNNQPENGKMVKRYWLDIVINGKSYISKTKLLGGKDNVVVSRYWTYHGGGNYAMDYDIKDIEVAKKSILDLNYDYKIFQDIVENCCFKGKKLIETNLDISKI